MRLTYRRISQYAPGIAPAEGAANTWASTYALQKCQKLASLEWRSSHEWVLVEGAARDMNGIGELFEVLNGAILE